jgi:hypothetical protein
MFHIICCIRRLWRDSLLRQDALSLKYDAVLSSDVHLWAIIRNQGWNGTHEAKAVPKALYRRLTKRLCEENAAGCTETALGGAAVGPGLGMSQESRMLTHGAWDSDTRLFKPGYMRTTGCITTHTIPGSSPSAGFDSEDIAAICLNR